MTTDPIVYAVRHLLGPNWVRDLDPREQPGIGAHVAHYAGLLEAGKLLIAGPFLESDRGGLAVAAADPTVASGLISFKIWTSFAATRRD